LDDPSDLLAYIVMDPTNLTFEDGSVSEILAIHPFEWLRAHGIDLRATDLFRRWYRVLRPGGKLVVKLGDVVPTETVVRVALSIAGFTGINVGPEQQIEAMV
jgi:predicted SAM-dependent methyltransferase